MDILTNINNCSFVYLQIKKFYRIDSNKNIYKEINPPLKIPIKLDINNRFLGNEIFSFNEFDRIEITFISNNQSDTLEIECYSECEEICNSDIGSKEYIKILNVGESAIISPGGDIEDMLVPGSYSINIKRENISYSGLYNINPANATWDELLNMRLYVEEAVKGLSYNIYMERKGKVELYNDIKNSIIYKYRYLNEVKDILIINLNSIINNPITKIEKIYKKCNNSKKTSNKSQRWMNKNGSKYNYNVNNPNIFYEKRSTISKDTLENKILKSILEEVYITIVELSLEFKSVQKQVIKNIDEINIKIDSIEDKKRGTNFRQNISKKLIKNWDSDLYVLKNEFEFYKRRYQQVDEYIINLYRIKSNISYYLKESWIEEIYNTKNSIPTMKFIKNKHYNQIYRIYENLKSSTMDGNKTKSFPHKKTSRLFEIYNFLLVKEILEELGFKWTSGWLRNQQDILSFNGDLDSNDYIILEFGEYKAKVIYDKLLRRSSEIIGCTESQVSAPRHISNIRPDILIEIYKEEDFICGMILEVKYRKLHHMYSYLADTDIGTQLESYIKMDYHDGRLGRVDRKKIAISKVIALYPQQKDARKIIDNTYSDVVFLPIMPSKIKDNTPNGYENLKNEIYETLFEYGIFACEEEILNNN